MNFKRILAFVLMAAALLTISSCKLIRKIEPEAESDAKDTQTSQETYNTDFTGEADTSADADTGLITSEDEAYDFLLASFPEEEKEKITVKKTGAMTAQSNGYEYYIFEIEKEGGEGETGEDSSQPVTYYVSVNGIVCKELSEVNTTTTLAKDAFFKKYTETDKDTGLKYKLEYKGLINNKGAYCFNFIVYLEKQSGELEYKSNYIVALDGRASAMQALEN